MIILIDNKYATDDISNFYRKSEYGGNKSINFDISTKNKYYNHISEESYVICDGEPYTVKTINERKGKATVTANLDLWELHSIIFSEFVTETEDLSDTLNKALKDTGWRWKYYNSSHIITKRSSISLSDCDSMDILQELTNTTSFNIFYKFDTKNKEIIVFSSSVDDDRGVFFTDELNMSELTFKGSSEKLITRIYPYGKDGLDIKSVNNGVEYVENLTYSNKIVSAVWRDERYTDAKILKEDAAKKLEVSAFPVRSYTCKILDLAKLTGKYSNLSFELYDIVTLIDRQRQTRVKHRITEIKEYPNEPTKNEITLSSVAEKITTKLDTVDKNLNNINKNIFTVANSVENKLNNAIKNATNLITGADGGHVLIHTDRNGKPYELLIMDTDDIQTARNVWRWNSGGFGHSSNGYNGKYTTAMTMDGAIVADMITAGTLQGIKVIADNGKIGGWNITSIKMCAGDSESGVAVVQKPTANTTWVFGAGGTSHDNYSDCPFRVSKAGKMYATNAEITGKVTADSGKIGGWTISDKGLTYGNEAHIKPNGIKLFDLLTITPQGAEYNGTVSYEVPAETTEPKYRKAGIKYDAEIRGTLIECGKTGYVKFRDTLNISSDYAHQNVSAYQGLININVDKINIDTTNGAGINIKGGINFENGTNFKVNPIIEGRMLQFNDDGTVTWADVSPDK